MRRAGSHSELLLDPTGERLLFTGKPGFVTAAAVDEARSLLVTVSDSLKSKTRHSMQTWSLSTRKRLSAFEFSDFPNQASAVALVPVGEALRVVILALGGGFFVTDTEGTVHFAAQLEKAARLTTLPGGRVAVDGAPPLIFDVVKNQFVASVEKPSWVSGAWSSYVLPGTTRLLILDSQRLALVDLARATEWAPVEVPPPTTLHTLATSPDSRLLAAIPFKGQGSSGPFTAASSWAGGAAIVVRLPE